MNVSTARVSILINKLEVKGYVERKTVEDDARKTIISLTEEARVYHQALEDKMTEMFAGMIDYVGKDDLDAFINILEKITTFLHDYPLDLDNEEGK